MFLTNAFRPDLRVLRESVILSKKFRKIKIYAWDREGAFESSEIIKKNKGYILVIRLKIPYVPSRGFLLRFLKRGFYTLIFNLIAVLNVLKKEKSKFIVAHCHDLDSLPAGFMLKYLGVFKRKKICLIFDSHEYWPGIPFFSKKKSWKAIIKLINDILSKIVDGIITVSDQLAMKLKNPKRGSKIIFPNIFLEDELNEIIKDKATITKQRKDKLRIFYFGPLSKVRGTLKLLRISEMLEKRGLLNKVEILIAGKGELEKEVMYYHRRGLVNYLGWLKENEVRKVLRESDVLFALYDPSIENNRYATPNKFFLALAYGVPILTNREIAFSEYVKKFDLGMLVNYDSAEQEVIDRIIEVLNNPERLIRIKENCYKAVKSDIFSPSKIAKKYLSQYINLCRECF